MTFKSGHLEFEENYNQVIGPVYGLKRLDNPVPIRYVTGFLWIHFPSVAEFRRARASRSSYKNRPVSGNSKFQARKFCTTTSMGRVKATMIEARDRVRQPALTLRNAAKCKIHVKRKKSCPPDDSGDARIPSESNKILNAIILFMIMSLLFCYTGLNVTLF